MDIERRSLPGAVLEERSGERPAISGHAGVYYDGTPATEFRLWDGAVERFMPGAFSPAPDVLATFNHTPGALLGRSSSGTLRLELDKRGLRYEIDLAETSIGRDVREHIRRGDVSGSSIGFVAEEDGWRRDGERQVREIRKATVYELGPVIEPAYAGTSAEARAIGSTEAARTSLERSDAGRLERIRREASAGPLRMELRAVGFRNEIRRRSRPVSRIVEELQERRCAAQHIGLWDCEPRWLQTALGLWKAGQWPMVSLSSSDEEDDELLDGIRISAGVAEVEIRGQITKRASSFGGASSLTLRRQIRALVDRPDVRGLWLRIDSPGGTAAGTDDLAAEVLRARRRGIEVEAYVEDLCASAAYWTASQASRITAGPTAEIGSIGTVLVLWDVSGKFRRDGIQTHIISTGPHKGAGACGAPITDQQLEAFRRGVDDHFRHFIGAVARGRGRTARQVEEEWASGDVWSAERAVVMGLIDNVSREEEALSRFRDSLKEE